MEMEPRPTDFVDYQAVFSQALTLVGGGASVSEALESCLRESYPLTYTEMLAEARAMVSRLRRERDWGALRALRELADRPGLAERMRVPAAREEAARAPRHGGVIADYHRIFVLAQRRRQAGFSLDDSLEMAVRELYPQTYRKILDAARLHVRRAARARGAHELRALRELAEDPRLLSSLDDAAVE